jgi:xanthine dehydrogenase YagS FAD-binding subunit
MLGALTRMAEVASDPMTAQAQPMLVEAVVEGASPQLRNMETIGGNLLVEDLYRLPEDTPHLEHTLAPCELILEVHVPHGSWARHARYLKVRDRASYEFALVSVAAALDIEHGLVRAARIAAGGVGTRPWRLRGCEAVLAGQVPGRTTWERAAQVATEGARPRSANAYEVELLERTMARALEIAGEMA